MYQISDQKMLEMKLSERVGDVFSRFHDDIPAEWGEKIPFGFRLTLFGLEEFVLVMIRDSEQIKEAED